MPKKSFKGIAPDNPALPYFSEQKEDIGKVGQNNQFGQDRPVVQQRQDGQVDLIVHNRPNGQDSPIVHDIHNRPVDHVVYNGQDRPDGQQSTDKTPKCHINLRVSQELKDYLTDASWRVRKSITQYLTDMIESDKKANQTKEGENNDI